MKFSGAMSLYTGIAYRPLRGGTSPLAVLITAIGVSYLLQNIALLIFGADTKSFTPVIKWKGIDVGGVKIQGITIVTISASILILCILQWFVHHTRQGQAMLAVAQDKEHGESEDVGRVGGNKAIFASTRGAEHTHALKRMAGAWSANKIFDIHRCAVGYEETESDS